MIEAIDEYPIPFDREEIVELQEESLDDPYSPVREEEDIERTVDGFHDEYIDEMTRTDEWSVFRCHWFASEWVYFWNFQLSCGFKVREDWEVMVAFVQMLEQFTEEYSAEDFEPAYYPWQLP